MKVSANAKPNESSATLHELANHMFTKKLGLSIPEHSPNSFRVMAARAKCMPKVNRNSRDQNLNSHHDLKETTKKIRDLTTIESQYSKYLMKFKSHNQLKDQKHVSQSFWTFIQHQPISMNTKQKLALKLNSPFRINLSEFGNKSLNVNKYISLLDSSDIQETQPTEEGKNPPEPLNDVGNVPECFNPIKKGLLAPQPDSTRLFPKATSRSGAKFEGRPRNRDFPGVTANNPDTEYHSGSPPSSGTRGRKFFKPQQVSGTPESSAPRIYPTPSRPTPKTFSGATGSAYVTSRTTNTNSAKPSSARLCGFYRRSPDATSRYELRETLHRPGTRESTWRPSFLQINPQKALLKDKFGQVMDRCDQMHQTGSSWMRNSNGYRGIEEKSLSRSSTPAYFKPVPYMVVKQKRRYEPSTQAEFSSFTPERSSPTETKRGLERAIKLRIAQRTAQQDAELAIRQVESQVELEIQQASQQHSEKECKPAKLTRPLLKRSGTKQGFSPRNNSPDNDVTLQANMLHNLISFGNPHATKQEVVERMIEFKDVGGRKLVKADVQMLAETRNFFITNAKAK